MPDTGDTEKSKRKIRAPDEAASKMTKTGVSTLSDAFELVEKQKGLDSFAKARQVLNQVRPFRPAVVVLTGKVKGSLLDDELEDDLSKEDGDTYLELSAVKHDPCCRGPAVGKYEKASKIVAVAKPVMEEYPEPRKLSQVAPVVEIMLTFTGVIVDLDSGSFSMEDYDSFLRWLDGACSNVEWMSAILDPAYLLIRAADGAAAPAGAIVALDNIPVGPIGRGAELSRAPTALVPPPRRTPHHPGFVSIRQSGGRRYRSRLSGYLGQVASAPGSAGPHAFCDLRGGYGMVLTQVIHLGYANNNFNRQFIPDGKVVFPYAGVLYILAWLGLHMVVGLKNK